MKKLLGRPRTAGENPDFVRLVKIAKQDAAFRRQLMAVLSLNEFHRQSLVNSWIEELRLNRAPAQFIEAISCLTNSEIAQSILTVLKSD